MQQPGHWQHLYHDINVQDYPANSLLSKPELVIRILIHPVLRADAVTGHLVV